METATVDTLLGALGIGGGGTVGIGSLIIAWKLLSRKNNTAKKMEYVEEKLCLARHATVEAQLQGLNTRLGLVLPQLEALPKRRTD